MEDGDGDASDVNGQHVDKKEVPPPHSSPLSLPPARAQTQPTGFPSPLIFHTLSSSSSSATGQSVSPLLQSAHNGVAVGGILHPAHAAASSSAASRSVFSRERLTAELQLGMRQVAGPAVAVTSPALQSNGSQAEGGRHRRREEEEDEQSAMLQQTLAAFMSLSPSLQSDCLLFFLADGAVLLELVNHFLRPQSGQATDALCKWLYDLHWNAAHAAQTAALAPAAAAGNGQQSLSSSSVSSHPASLFLLHLVPVLVFSFLYRTSRSLPVPGIAAVLLGIYNAQKALQPQSPSRAAAAAGLKLIDPNSLVSTVYGSPSLTLPPPPPATQTANHYHSAAAQQPRPAQNNHMANHAAAAASTARPAGTPAGGGLQQQQLQQQSPLSPSSASPLPSLSDLSGSSVLLLVHVVLQWYLSRISAVSLLSQQQFCYLCAILCDNHSQGEIHRTLRDYSFQWTADWEQQMAASGKKHVRLRDRRQQQHSDEAAVAGGGGGAEDEAEDSERNGPRYVLTVSLLQDLLVGLTYCACYPGTKTLSLLSLRAIHCRAVEELMPQVLLQTTAILESVEE